MVFGSTGYLKDAVVELVIGHNWPSQESWYANDAYSTAYFGEGKFVYAIPGSLGITSISADCDKF